MKKISIAILFILALIVLAFTVLVNSAKAEIEAEDPGIPWGDYRITWRSSDQTNYKLEYINEPGAYCQIEVKADCVEPELPAPSVGDVCKRVGNQKWDCPGNTQDLRWTETTTQKCWAHIANVGKSLQCSCDGYKSEVKKNGKRLFYLDLLPGGNTGPLVNLTIGDAVQVVHTWNGGSPTADPCYVGVSVKIKIEGNPDAKWASCDGAVCTYYASQIGADKYANVTDTVELKTGVCYGNWENFDPDSNEDPIAPEE
jgi:hypothetical protein